MAIELKDRATESSGGSGRDTPDYLLSSGDEDGDDYAHLGVEEAMLYAHSQERPPVTPGTREGRHWHDRLLAGFVAFDEASSTVRDVDGMRRYFGRLGVVGPGARDRLALRNPTPPIHRF